MDDGKSPADVNAGMVVGFILICLSSFVLIICCCCYRDYDKRSRRAIDSDEKCLPTDEERGLDLVETDSSGSESSRDTSALIMFMKGLQAGMAEGFENDPLDAYAIGYIDGSHFASERKEPLTDAQVVQQAKKLGYGGPSANAYVEGFQNGVRNGISTESPNQRQRYESGLLNAEARGLHYIDREAYARGYAAGDASGVALENESDVIQKAECSGFTGSHAELFAAGFSDGVNGLNATHVLSLAAAFQKGLSNAAALGLSEDVAIEHANGFGDGYGLTIVGDGTNTPSQSDMLAKAKDAGLTGERVKSYCAGFEEGVDEASMARKHLILKGMDRAEKYGMTNDSQSAFAVGYKDGCVHASSGKAPPGDQMLKETSRSLLFSDDNASAYIRGFRDASESSSKSNTTKGVVLLPDALFEKGFLEAKEQDSDDEAAAARAAGMHDGYRHGFTGGAVKTKQALLTMAGTAGFLGHDADIYVASFQTGVLHGHQARDATVLNGRRRASGLGMSGDAAKAYSSGYRDGHAHMICGGDPAELSESTVKKSAQKVGTAASLTTTYINGFQDGRRDGNEIVQIGHTYSSEASYAKGLIEAKEHRVDGEICHVFASGYSEGYKMGMEGSDELTDEEVLASAAEHDFDDTKSRKAFSAGFTGGYDDGIETRKKHAKRVLSPNGALERGLTNASASGLKDEAANAYAGGFSDGYAVGLAGHQCRTESQLMDYASDLDFSGKSRNIYTSGFQEGWKEGSAGAANKSVAGLSSDDAMKKGHAKAAVHGMRGSTADAFGSGYRDGYAEGLKRVADFSTAPDLSREELASIARSLGFTKTKQVHAHIAGHLVGQKDGGIVVRHHSLCDVHRCISNTCTICRQMKEPVFLHIPHGYTLV